MNNIKCAVIGVGYLGRFHAQKLKQMPGVDLIAVCDINQETAVSVAKELDVSPCYNFHTLLNDVDAITIAATTRTHFDIAKACISAGKHVLIEKPITETVAQANELIELAKKHKVKLQVGHLERFNSARMALDDYLDRPRFIESQRIAPYKPRGTDVNVVLDLMIHDIDILQSIVKAPIKHIDAQGAPILSQDIDIANARLHFANGCVANVTASRISFKSERKTRIFQPNSYISIDYQNKKFAVFEKGTGEMFPGIPEILRHESCFDKSDALYEEIASFIDCIIYDKQPIVSGEDGCSALEIASKITLKINQHLAEIAELSSEGLWN